MPEDKKKLISHSQTLIDLAKSGAMTAMNANAAIREKLTASLLNKSDSMEPKEILDILERLDDSKSLVSYKNLIKLLEGE